MKRALADKVAWVTGATSGIGRECALELGRAGAIVAASGRRADRLEALCEEIRASGGRALAVPCDVQDETQTREAVARIVAEHGRLDLALANAGFAVGGRVEELTAAEWRQQLDVNVVGAALTARAAIPELKKTRGRLALTGSVAAFLPAPGFAAYHASKYAVRALGQCLAVELEPSGVSVTLLHPGFVASEINQVDNRGKLHPDRTDRRPQYLMWPTDRAARVMVRAIAERRRELVFTGHGKFAAFVGQHFPGVLHFVMTRGSMQRQANDFRID
jgi:NAD(P)-dependent dehydrogenase (short-subunit alcohol dehydrogenase family)